MGNSCQPTNQIKDQTNNKAKYNIDSGRQSYLGINTFRTSNKTITYDQGEFLNDQHVESQDENHPYVIASNFRQSNRRKKDVFPIFT